MPFNLQTTLDSIENNTITDLKIKDSDIRYINEEGFARIATLLINNNSIKTFEIHMQDFENFDINALPNPNMIIEPLRISENSRQKIIKALTLNQTITDVTIKYFFSMSDHTSTALENLLKQNHTITKFELSYSRLHHTAILSLFRGLSANNHITNLSLDGLYALFNPLFPQLILTENKGELIAQLLSTNHNIETISFRNNFLSTAEAELIIDALNNQELQNNTNISRIILEHNNNNVRALSVSEANHLFEPINEQVSKIAEDRRKRFEKVLPAINALKKGTREPSRVELISVVDFLNYKDPRFSEYDKNAFKYFLSRHISISQAKLDHLSHQSIDHNTNQSSGNSLKRKFSEIDDEGNHLSRTTDHQNSDRKLPPELILEIINRLDKAGLRNLVRSSYSPTSPNIGKR